MNKLKPVKMSLKRHRKEGETKEQYAAAGLQPVETEVTFVYDNELNIAAMLQGPVGMRGLRLVAQDMFRHEYPDDELHSALPKAQEIDIAELMDFANRPKTRAPKVITANTVLRDIKKLDPSKMSEAEKAEMRKLLGLV